jgi:hypothetical protein
MVFVNEIKQLEGREKVMWQREFDGVEGIGTPEHPWIIGFSGGKNSTILLTLVKIREDNPAATLKRQVIAIAKLLKVNPKELLTLWLANRIIAIVARKEFATQVLNIAKQNINNL